MNMKETPNCDFLSRLCAKKTLSMKWLHRTRMENLSIFFLWRLFFFGICFITYCYFLLFHKGASKKRLHCREELYKRWQSFSSSQVDFTDDKVLLLLLFQNNKALQKHLKTFLSVVKKSRSLSLLSFFSPFLFLLFNCIYWYTYGAKVHHSRRIEKHWLRLKWFLC